MDGILRSADHGHTALVLTGLELTRDEQIEANMSVINALRVWALDDDVLAVKSLVCLVSANPANVLDQSRSKPPYWRGLPSPKRENGTPWFAPSPMLLVP